MAVFGLQTGDATRFANSELPDLIIKDLMENMQDLGIEPQAALLVGEDTGEKKIETLARTYYTTGDGMLEGGLNDEARNVEMDLAYDVKKVNIRSFDARFLIQRSVLEYGEDSRYVESFRINVEETMAGFWDSFNQDLADMVLRGWETSYRSGWKNKNGSQTLIDGRDLEGSNPFFAPNHKIIAGTTNDFRWSNVCVRKTASGGYVINPELSKEAIQDTYQYTRKVRNYKGNLQRGKNINTLICSSDSHSELYQLIMSTHEVHTANNGIETFKLIVPGVSFFEWNRLYQDGEGNLVNANSGTNYDKFWFMVDLANVKKELHYQFHRIPTLVKESTTGNSESEAYFTRGKYIAYTTPKGYIFGSNGKEEAAPADFPLI